MSTHTHTCPSCNTPVRAALLVRRDAQDRAQSEPLDLDPHPVPTPNATVIRVTIRPDDTWIVVPVAMADNLPVTLQRDRPAFRAHVCAAPPDTWIDRSVLSGAAAAGAS